MSEMTNEQIVSEFESLFGSEEPTEEEVQDTAEDETPEEETPEETADESSDEQTGDEGSSDKDEEVDEAPAKDNKQSKQNHAFAEQRLQIKKQNDFIKKVGKLVGFDDNTDTDKILEKVNEALLEKQAKEQNIPVELLKRIEAAEAVIQENNQIKLEKQVTDAFAGLIEEHNLTEEDVQNFTNYLIDNGKNPMLDANVDIQAEYLKLHYKDMVQAAVDAALAKESDRKKKVDEQSSSSLDPSPQDKDEKDISSVKDLDDLFGSMDL